MARTQGRYWLDSRCAPILAGFREKRAESLRYLWELTKTDMHSPPLRLHLTDLDRPVKIFSLSHIIELAAELPDPAKAEPPEIGYNTVVRLPIRDWDAVRDADHPEREFDAHDNPFVEFELLQWKDNRGRTFPRWVLRGLLAI